MSEAALRREPDGTAKIRLPRAKDGVMMLPSAMRNAADQPRFHLPIPPGLVNDVAIRHLVEREMRYGGFEYPTRAFLDAHLEPGDLFIDVGAHWGVMAMTAASHPRAGPDGEIAVLAVEAHPLNVVQLMSGLARSRLIDRVEVIAAAAGDRPGTAPLVANSTMGHSLRGVGLAGIKPQGPSISVPIVTLDDLLAERPALAERPVLIKIDVEGFEPQVIEGARRLLESGRVKAIVWEKGRAFDSEPGFSAMAGMLTRLESLGFRNMVMPSHDLGGPLLPFVPGKGSCNVFALARGLEPERAYVRPYTSIPPISPSNRGSDDPQERRALTAALMLVKGSEGTRWSDPRALVEGAEPRARLALPYIEPGEQVVDLGAGTMRLRPLLPESCGYRPVDLIPFAVDTLVLDLNREVPTDEADVIVALELLEYIHNVPALLEALGETGGRLICSYRCHDGGPVEARRSQGWFNDYDAEGFEAVLSGAGWELEASEAGADTRLFVCRRAR